MPVTRNDKSAWSLRGTVAVLNTGQLSAQVDISRPNLGAQHVQWSEPMLASSLLAVARDDDDDETQHAWPLSLADAYARGDDLIASYSPRDDWPFSMQVYWRAAQTDVHNESRTALSLLVSVQTNLLDTRPCIRVGSRIEADEVLLVDLDNDHEATIKEAGRTDHKFTPTAHASIVVARLAAANYSYIEIMPASDFRHAAVRWTAGGQCETRWSLFADFLEKGVIWRARLHALIVPRTDDIELATSVCRAMDQWALPLTV
jgi:hypothetical protein